MRTFLFILTLAIGGGESLAQSTGVDRPIRVGMLNGYGTGAFNHTNLHTASSVVAALLASPASAGLGDSLVIPGVGFSFYSMPVATNSSGVPCGASGTGCGPSPAQIDTIVAALDTLDVLIMNSNVGIGFRIGDPAHRQAFENFWANKGLVSIHATNDTKGSWARLDTVNGTMFNNHPAEQTATLRADSVFMNDADWRYLNRGLFHNGLDTSFFEEWFFYTNTGAEIRSRAHLKPTTRLEETGMTGIGSLEMGDHPHSWFRKWPTGGRTFYTGLGHRAQAWQQNRTFRRQLYNAILWTAKYDSVASVSLRPQPSGARFEDFAFVTFNVSRVKVFMLHDGSHTLEVRGLDGRLVQTRRGEGRVVHEIAGLPAGLHAVSITTPRGRATRVVATP